MPPKIRYSKADLLHAAFKLTREKGIDAVNARAVGKELGCSTQPIFRAFKSMEDVKGQILRMAMDLYGIYITRSGTVGARPYLYTGMAYLAFARDEPELFKLLFMSRRDPETAAGDLQDETIDFVIDLVMRRTGLNREQAKRFHEHIWIYTHGLAAMIATRYVTISEEKMERLLMDEYLAMRKLYGLPPPEDEAENE